MRNKNTGAEPQSNSAIFLVYYYLLAGIALLVSVFLFLPRVAAG